MKRVIICEKCGSNKFSFRWEYKIEDEMRMYLCHDGWGFQITDCIVTCAKCGIESEYKKASFLSFFPVKEIKVEGVKKT